MNCRKYIGFILNVYVFNVCVFVIRNRLCIISIICKICSYIYTYIIDITSYYVYVRNLLILGNLKKIIIFNNNKKALRI